MGNGYVKRERENRSCRHTLRHLQIATTATVALSSSHPLMSVVLSGGDCGPSWPVVRHLYGYTPVGRLRNISLEVALDADGTAILAYNQIIGRIHILDG